MSTPGSARRFAIAVSFPGEHRRFVRNVVNRLAEELGKERIFFDEWYEAELLGLDGAVSKNPKFAIRNPKSIHSPLSAVCVNLAGGPSPLARGAH